MELSLDLSLDSVPKTVPEILTEVSSIQDCSTKQVRLDEHVKRLEDELRKIDAFKRELPLCVLLLKDAISRLKEEMVQFPPVIEEFIPLKGNSDEGDDGFVPRNPVENCGERQRAFQLFKDQSEFAMKEDVGFSEVPKLTLMTPISDPSPKKGHNKLSQQQQTLRKQRRCWSPELHRRFVDALHRLGGSQVATPKQIRELMQVDGLTNDEVKSHLQKYRLHVRKLGPTDTWLSEEQHFQGHSKTSLSHAGSPDGPLILAGGSGSGKALSMTEGDSTEAEEDAKSDGHSWKLAATS